MKCEENAKHSEARKNWKMLFMLCEARLEFFQKILKLGPKIHCGALTLGPPKWGHSQDPLSAHKVKISTTAIK